MKRMMFLVLVVLVDRRAESSQDLMKAITIDFTKALDVCKVEMDLPDTIEGDFLNFWRDDYELSDPTTGCAIICLSAKLHLVEPDGTVHYGNAQEFAKTHGADDATALRLVDILHQCEVAAPASDDACLKVLGIAKCFKAEVCRLDRAPDMYTMREIVAEI